MMNIRSRLERLLTLAQRLPGRDWDFDGRYVRAFLDGTPLPIRHGPPPPSPIERFLAAPSAGNAESTVAPNQGT
jgi:hypothetical protein